MPQNTSFLTHFSLMDLPTLTSRMSPFPIKGMLGGTFHFFPNFNKPFCKQTVKILIRHCIIRCLIWICTVCLCPIKRMPGLYGLKHLYIARSSETVQIPTPKPHILLIVPYDKTHSMTRTGICPLSQKPLRFLLINPTYYCSF